jgi:hypothetical protein
MVPIVSLIGCLLIAVGVGDLLSLSVETDHVSNSSVPTPLLLDLCRAWPMCQSPAFSTALGSRLTAHGDGLRAYARGKTSPPPDDVRSVAQAAECRTTFGSRSGR